MQFRDGTNVYSFDGQKVGHIGRVILNPKTQQVTHIIVRKGFLFTEDKIVPLHMIASATEDRISLSEDADKMDDLLPFEETHYIPVDMSELRTSYSFGTASALYWYPPMGGRTYGGGRYSHLYRTETERNTPHGSLALKEGVRVFSDNNQHVGNVTRIFTESPDDRMVYFLMSEGIFFKEKKLIPASWIGEMQEEEIHLSVGTSVLGKLPEYQEA